MLEQHELQALHEGTLYQHRGKTRRAFFREQTALLHHYKHISRCRAVGFCLICLFLIQQFTFVTSESIEPTQTEKKVAIVTLLTTSTYLPGTLVLAESLRRVNAKGEKILLWVGPEDDPRSDITPAQIAQIEKYWDRTIQLSKKNGTYTECRISSQQKALIEQNPSLKSLDRYWGTCSKFAVWTLTEYDVVVYMDADSIALNNFDFVFDYVGGEGQGAFAAHGVPECWDDPPQCENFYTAFMVIKPLPNVQEYLHILAQQQYLAEGEITLLNKVIQQWRPLPRFTLCAQTETVRPIDGSGKIDWGKVNVYDFAGAPEAKPWVSYELSKQHKDPTWHGYFGSVPPGAPNHQRYMVPQLLWNEYYDNILQKEATRKNRGKQEEVKQDKDREL